MASDVGELLLRLANRVRAPHASQTGPQSALMHHWIYGGVGRPMGIGTTARIRVAA